jgi:hypothetical protein
MNVETSDTTDLDLLLGICVSDVDVLIIEVVSSNSSAGGGIVWIESKGIEGLYRILGFRCRTAADFDPVLLAVSYLGNTLHWIY